MKTRVVLLAVLAVGALAGAGGCADNAASVQVQGICYPTEECSAGAGCDVFLYGVPLLVKPTAGSTARLSLQLQVENQLPDNENPETGNANTNDAIVDEIYVEYDTVLGEFVPPPAGTNAYIPAKSTGVVLALLSVPATLPSGEVVARVRLRGEYHDTSRFETAEFPITFEYCASGCPAVTTCAVGQEVCPPGAISQAPVLCIDEAAEEPVAKPGR